MASGGAKTAVMGFYVQIDCLGIRYSCTQKALQNRFEFSDNYNLVLVCTIVPDSQAGHTYSLLILIST